MKAHRVASIVLWCFSLSLGFAGMGCSSHETPVEDPVTPSLDKEAAIATADDPTPLAVATVASLISVSDVMVREPERFKKALCSDGNIYDLEYSGGRYSLRAEPLSVCVLFADTKTLKPSGFCGDARCEATMVNECSEADKQELLAAFAKDQTVQRCWNIGQFSPLSFSVLMTRVGQSCQAQTLIKGPKGWRQMTSIDGSFETRASAAGGESGCSFESGSSQTYEGDWFAREKRVVPVMAFAKDGGSYALLKSGWGGSENFQLFRLDGEELLEVESFAESFKEAPPETTPPLPSTPEPQPTKAKVKSSSKKSAPAPPVAEPAEETTPSEENPSKSLDKENPVKDEATQESGVNPLEAEQ